MRVGSLVYATDQGLGILAHEFYQHGIVTDVVVVQHAHRPTHYEWYPGAKSTPIHKIERSPHLDIIREFCKSMDVVLLFETPFVWSIINYCREQGVKTALMPMYECCPPRAELPYQPDVFLCPSLLDLDYYMDTSRVNKGSSFEPFGRHFGNAVFSPIPVDIAWKERTVARTFVHNAGWGGLKGRNGTLEVERAIPLVKSDARFIIRVQRESREWRALENDTRVSILWGTRPYSTLYEDGDVFLFPEKFNGLSLPLQEAYASGMLVMAGARFPMTMWLPSEPLIPVHSTRKNRISGRCNEFVEAAYDHKHVAATIDAWYGHDITEYSHRGKRWAEQNSWQVLGPQYKSFLQEVVEGRFP